MFEGMIGRFSLIVRAPYQACYLCDLPQEVIDFILHKDGADIKMDQKTLIGYMNDPNNWTRDSDGHYLSCHVKHGFTWVEVLLLSPLPTLLFNRCSWCGQSHYGGQENCKS